MPFEQRRLERRRDNEPLDESVWLAVGFHAGWDWDQSYFYGTPNSGLVMKGHRLAEHPRGNPLWSGGTAGPEASLLLLPLLILMAICMWVWWGKKKPIDC